MVETATLALVLFFNLVVTNLFCCSYGGTYRYFCQRKVTFMLFQGSVVVVVAILLLCSTDNWFSFSVAKQSSSAIFLFKQEFMCLLKKPQFSP